MNSIYHCYESCAPEDQHLPQTNYRLLVQEVAQIALNLEARLESKQTDALAMDLCASMRAPSLDKLCSLFALSEVDRKLLLLCLALEIDPLFSTLCVKYGNPCPTLRLAFLLFGEQWVALSPSSALRYYALIELIDHGTGFVHQTIKLSPWTLFYLTKGISDGPWLRRRLRRSPGVITELDSQCRDAQRLSRFWHHQTSQTETSLKERTAASLSTAQLVAADTYSAIQVAAIASTQCQLALYTLDLQVLPSCYDELDIFRRLLERELIVNPFLLFIDCSLLVEAQLPEEQHHRLKTFIETLIRCSPCSCVLFAAQPLSLVSVIVESIYLQDISVSEQLELWKKNLAVNASKSDRINTQIVPDNDLQQLSNQFNFNSREISAIVRRAQCDTDNNNPLSAAMLWHLCREKKRLQLNGLAHIIAPGKNCWENIVLPEEERICLRSLVTQVSQRQRVYQNWGFGRESGYGNGICALFAGSSGTGKTMAARIIASELQLDIYQVDLGNVADKYIGETEKNLEKIFRAAEYSGAILLFDEADALFGKRTKVNDSRDRHANMGVSFLLQRIESYNGLSILTTNHRSSMDDAFLRRFRFIIQFPFPSEQERYHIWKNVFPARAPTEALDYRKLARLSLSGGSIRNIALQAAFHAAGENSVIGMKHILEATRQDYIKAEKSLRDDLVYDWVCN